MPPRHIQETHALRKRAEIESPVDECLARRMAAARAHNPDVVACMRHAFREVALTRLPKTDPRRFW